MEKVVIKIYSVKDAEKLYTYTKDEYNAFQDRMRIKYNGILWNMTKTEKQENDRLASNYTKAIQILYNARNCDTLKNQKPVLCKAEIIDRRN